MGGELVVTRDLNQESSATSSLAKFQQRSSALSQHNKHKKHQNYFNNKKHNDQEPTQSTQNTQTSSTQYQYTNTPNHTPNTDTRARKRPWRQKKGRATNRWNSKQRKELRKIALEGLPSGSPGQPRGFGFCGDQMTQAILPRNSKRGIRSKEKLQKEKLKEATKEGKQEEGKG